MSALTRRLLAAAALSAVAATGTACSSTTHIRPTQSAAHTSGSTRSSGGSENFARLSKDGGELTYDGHAVVTVTTYDYCTQTFDRERTGTKSYQYDAQLVVSSPQSDGIDTEPNPFDIAFLGGPKGNQWSVALASALTTTTSGYDQAGHPRDARLLLNYWQLRYDHGRLDGTLTDTHASEAAVYNAVMGEQELVPCRPELGTMPSYEGFAKGTSLRGTLDKQSADLTLDGETTDGLVHITLRFTA